MALGTRLGAKRAIKVHAGGDVLDDQLPPSSTMRGFQSVKAANEREGRYENVAEACVALAKLIASDAAIGPDEGYKDWD